MRSCPANMSWALTRTGRTCCTRRVGHTCEHVGTYAAFVMRVHVFVLCARGRQGDLPASGLPRLEIQSPGSGASGGAMPVRVGDPYTCRYGESRPPTHRGRRQAHAANRNLIGSRVSRGAHMLSRMWVSPSPRGGSGQARETPIVDVHPRSVFLGLASFAGWEQLVRPGPLGTSAVLNQARTGASSHCPLVRCIRVLPHGGLTMERGQCSPSVVCFRRSPFPGCQVCAEGLGCFLH